MGAYTELVMAVRIRPDAPEAFLATLASAQVGEGGPPLPEPVPADESWSPGDWWEEVHQGTWEPLTRPWGYALNVSWYCAAWPGRTGTELEWDRFGKTWILTVRVTDKTLTRGMAGMIEWMAPYVCPNARHEEPKFVGYIICDYDARPTLIWHDGARFTFEGIEDSVE